MEILKSFNLIILLAINTMVFAEAPELRNAMPNSWRKLEKLTTAEEQDFMISNKEAIESDGLIKAMRRDAFNPVQKEFNYYQVYKEVIGADTFYRVLNMHEEAPDFTAKYYPFIQVVFYKNNIIAACSYAFITDINMGDSWDLSKCGKFQCIDIVGTNNRVLGILLTTAVVKIDDNFNFIDKINGEFFGKDEANYFPFSNIPADGRIKTNNAGNIAPNVRFPEDHIWILPQIV
jgi:hypothetical protein